MSNALPPLLTAQDVGLWLALPTDRVLRLARQGQIPCVVLPDNEVVFDPGELARWVTSLRIPGRGGHHAE